MAEKLFRPDKSWWRTVTDLDQTLFERGKRDRDGLYGRFGDRRITRWGSDDSLAFRLVAARAHPLFLRQPLESSLLQIEVVPLDSGYQGMIRRVSYTPSGIFSLGGHGVSDDLHVVDFKQLNVDAGFEAEKANAHIARRAQRRLGFSLPTEETFDFILRKLKQGVEMTG